MRKRTLAREIAMQALYQADVHERARTPADPGSRPPNRELRPPANPELRPPTNPDAAGLVAEENARKGLPNVPESHSQLAPEVKAYALELIEGTIDTLDELDEQISSVAQKWKLSRIAFVDRSILRLGLYELLYSADVPPKVAIDEAINLAKKFSTTQSGSFVNGILDRLYNARLLDATPSPTDGAKAETNAKTESSNLD